MVAPLGAYFVLHGRDRREQILGLSSIMSCTCRYILQRFEGRMGQLIGSNADNGFCLGRPTFKAQSAQSCERNRSALFCLRNHRYISIGLVLATCESHGVRLR